MKLSEAREIVGQMANWHFSCMGIAPSSLVPMNYSLDQMIKANQIIEKNNKIQSKKTGPYTLSVTLDDRLIAAQYVAMNFTADYASEAEVKSGANGKLVYVIKS